MNMHEIPEGWAVVTLARGRALGGEVRLDDRIEAVVLQAYWPERSIFEINPRSIVAARACTKGEANAVGILNRHEPYPGDRAD